MSTLNPPKTISKRHELRQDRVVTVYARAWEFVAENQKLVYGIAAGLLVAVLAVAAFFYLQFQRGERAQELMGGIVSVYEAEQYENALNGTETAMGLLEIADQFGGTDAGNLAHFYAADALFRLGRLDEALDYFDAFEKSNNLVGASAYAGEAAVYEQRGEFERAGDLYRRAALAFENQVTSPSYLLSAGQAYEQGGAYPEAAEVYQRIKDDYPDSELANGMDFYLARVRAAQQ